MNSQEFRQAARTAFALAMDAYYTGGNDDNPWIADQHTANTMAQAELDAATAKGCEEVAEVVSQDFATMTVEELREYAETVQAKYDADKISGAMGRAVVRGAWERLAEAESKAATTAAEVIAQINTNEAFGIAWGADGEVLSYDETTAAIDAGRGWFDRQGRWVNMARMNAKASLPIGSN